MIITGYNLSEKSASGCPTHNGSYSTQPVQIRTVETIPTTEANFDSEDYVIMTIESSNHTHSQ